MAAPNPSAFTQEQVNALLWKVNKLQIQVSKMRKQFRPLKSFPVRDAKIPLLPSSSNPKVFLYFTNFPRRAICAVKSMLRNGYSLDCRGAIFSFIGADILEVLISEDKSQSFVNEMELRGHRTLSSSQAYSGWQVKLKGSATECRDYAKAACQRRWLQLQAQAKDVGTVAAYEKALQVLGKEAESDKVISASTRQESGAASSEETGPRAKRQKTEPTPSASSPTSSSSSTTPTPSSPSFVPMSAKSPASRSTQEPLMGLKKGFFGASPGKGLFG